MANKILDCSELLKVSHRLLSMYCSPANDYWVTFISNVEEMTNCLSRQVAGEIS